MQDARWLLTWLRWNPQVVQVFWHSDRLTEVGNSKLSSTTSQVSPAKENVSGSGRPSERINENNIWFSCKSNVTQWCHASLFTCVRLWTKKILILFPIGHRVFCVTSGGHVLKFGPGVKSLSADQLWPSPAHDLVQEELCSCPQEMRHHPARIDPNHCS